MSFCPNCGTELNGNPLFCPECGAYLMNADTQEKTAAAAAVQQPSQPQPQPQPAQAQPQYQQQQPQAQQQTYYQPPSNDFQQMPAQTLPQQQIPPQQGYAPSMAPVQEEKASIGLAILSFFIPLVGLILFFVKRKKRPKTAKACLTAAVISVLLSTVMSCFAGKDDTANEIKESISQIAVEDDTTEAKAAAANDVCGKFGDGKYTNAYFDISYTLPDNFAFKSNQEIADIVGSEIDASTGVAKFSQASMDMYYDSAAFSSASGASIMTICVPSGALLKVADLSEKELL